MATIGRAGRLNAVLVLVLGLSGLVGQPTDSVQAGPLKFRTGLGYDYFSQDFQADSLTNDSLDAVINLGSTYFDNLRGQIGIEYAPGQRGSMLLKSWFEQSAKDSRFRFSAGFEFDLGGWRLISEQELDWRQSLEDSTVTDRSYWLLRTRNRLRRPLGGGTDLKAEFRAEMIQFDLDSAYNQDFSRIGGRFGLSHTFEQFSSIGLDFFVTSRTVPDSTVWNYLNSGVEGSLAWLHSHGELDLLLRAERKNYDQSDLPDTTNYSSAADFRRLEGYVYSRISLGNLWSFKQLGDLEVVTFEADDELNYDYTKLKLGLMTGLQSLSAGLFAGPAVEWLVEGDSSPGEQLLGSQAYTEISLVLQGDYMMAGRGFFSIESEFGHRDLTGETPSESDFYYERIDLLLDASLYGPLRFSALASVEWEFHRNPAEDNRSFLISTGVSCRF